MKRCTVCQLSQADGEFYRDSRAADGRQGICRTCAKEGRPKFVTCTPVGDWQDDAACRTADPQLFWAEKGEEAAALAICRSCPVQPQCLDWALRNRQALFVIGGTTADERQRMFRAAQLNGAA